MTDPLFAAFDQGQMPTIAFVNKAKHSLGVDLAALVAACQKALDEPQGFVAVWGTPARLIIADEIPSGAWGMLFLDNADEAGALGYHDLTPDGLPLSKVFVETTLRVGESVSVTTSHECWEMLLDPAINLWAMAPSGALWAYEASDVVEATHYSVDGMAISNWVYPAFFEGFRAPRSAKFDHLGLLTRPFSLLADGYSIINKGGRITQVFGSREKAMRFANEDRRGHRSEYRKAI